MKTNFIKRLIMMMKNTMMKVRMMKPKHIGKKLNLEPLNKLQLTLINVNIKRKKKFHYSDLYKSHQVVLKKSKLKMILIFIKMKNCHITKKIKQKMKKTYRLRRFLQSLN